MTKERIKSVILVLLIIVNLMLAERILVNEKLWPVGYNFFNMRTTAKKNDYSIIGHLWLPEKIIVNTGYQSSRFEYLRNSQDFSKISLAAGDVLKKAFSAPLKSAVSVTSDVWYSALTAKSIYLSYSCNYSAQNFANLHGLLKTEFNFESFSDVVINENGNVFISDKNGSAFYRIDISSSEISPIIEKVAEEHSSDESAINYSFDLNFDKGIGGQTTFLSPMIPIYSAPVVADVLLSSNPVIRDDEFINKVIGEILTAFSIKPNTVRRYTEADGSLVFVENNGILRISPDGILHFKATSSGIKLSPNTTYDTYSSVSNIANFIDTVNAAAGINADMCITSSLTSSTTESFTFEYFADSLPVRFTNGHAVTARVENGYISEYTQILRKYEPCGQFAESPLYIEALDSVIAEYQGSMKEINITKMIPAYVDDLTISEKYPHWHIKIDNIVAE